MRHRRVAMNGSTLAESPGDDETGAGLLAPLGDIDGIWGSFVLSDQGDLLLWDMPPGVSEEMLDAGAPRLTRLREALARNGQDVELCMLRFARHRLCLRASNRCV